MERNVREQLRILNDSVAHQRRQIAGLNMRVSALESAAGPRVDPDDVDPVITALFEVLALPCLCERMRVRTELRQTVEVPLRHGSGAHWTGCHVAIAARGLGDRIRKEEE
jgi:hypothetical protein